MNNLTELDRAILRVVAGKHEPVGQGTIALEIRKQGISVSGPTVGRRLQELEYKGYLDKVTAQGRVITEKGESILDDIWAEAMLRPPGDELLKTLSRGDRQHLFDLLAARMAIEGATAALAAEHASAETIQELESLMERQQESIRRGEFGVAEDVGFHNLIARASGNDVLRSLVAVLRQHHRYNLALFSIRAKVGSRLVIDHEAILKAIKARNPIAARKAMERHLMRMTEDIRQFWPDVSEVTTAAVE